MLRDDTEEKTYPNNPTLTQCKPRWPLPYHFQKKVDTPSLKVTWRHLLTQQSLYSKNKSFLNKGNILSVLSRECERERKRLSLQIATLLAEYKKEDARTSNCMAPQQNYHTETVSKIPSRAETGFTGSKPLPSASLMNRNIQLASVRVRFSYP